MTPTERKRKAMRQKLLKPVTPAQAAIINSRMASMLMAEFIKNPRQTFISALGKVINQFDKEEYGGELKRMQAEIVGASQIVTPLPGGRTRVDTYKGGKRISRIWETTTLKRRSK